MNPGNFLDRRVRLEAMREAQHVLKSHHEEGHTGREAPEAFQGSRAFQSSQERVGRELLPSPVNLEFNLLHRSHVGWRRLGFESVLFHGNSNFSVNSSADLKNGSNRCLFISIPLDEGLSERKELPVANGQHARRLPVK